jgi:hypothetical protein
MTEREDDRWPLPLVVLGAIAALPLLAWRLNDSQNRWSAEVASHPWTWPVRVALFFLLAIPGGIVVRRVFERDKENDPLWKRLMHLIGAFALGGLLVFVLSLVDRVIP